ncbi:MAG: CAP domain-containing protein [Anaerolineae bacterium]|nr:CAP domain-containing protein [Anaerolineae bacterium]
MTTASYTSYLPIIAHSSLAEPLYTLIELINAERQKHGLPPLRINSTLMQVAQMHSQNMAERDFFDHVDPATGMDACQRIASAGYAVRACAENLAAGYRTAQTVFQAWMHSPQHRANLLSPDFAEIGLGYAEGGRYGYYWTANLARPL